MPSHVEFRSYIIQAVADTNSLTNIQVCCDAPRDVLSQEGVSPKARRKIPRAPLMSRSILCPSEDLTVLRPPRLWIISPVQLTVFEV